MKFQIILLAILLTFPATVFGQSEITAHLETVEAHLRAKDVSAWPAAKQAARETTLNNLRRYHQQGVYPRNTDFPDARVPYFVDDKGTNCAVAELMMNSGFEEEVGEIAASENNHWLHEMTSPDLLRWTDAAGISVEEAAWIQPTYEFCVQTEFISPPETANCGDAIELKVRELECSTTYIWRLLRNEEVTEETFSEKGSAQTYTFPETTLDAERFTFQVVTKYDDGINEGGIMSETNHTITVACDGQDSAPPKKEKPIGEDISGPDMGSVDVGPDSGSGVTKDDAGCSTNGSKNTGLLVGLLFVFGATRKRRRSAN